MKDVKSIIKDLRDLNIRLPLQDENFDIESLKEKVPTDLLTSIRLFLFNLIEVNRSVGTFSFKDSMSKFSSCKGKRIFKSLKSFIIDLTSFILIVYRFDCFLNCWFSHFFNTC